jgi:hypothetical protein
VNFRQPWMEKSKTNLCLWDSRISHLNLMFWCLRLDNFVLKSLEILFRSKPTKHRAKRRWKTKDIDSGPRPAFWPGFWSWVDPLEVEDDFVHLHVKVKPTCGLERVRESVIVTSVRFSCRFLRCILLVIIPVHCTVLVTKICLNLWQNKSNVMLLIKKKSNVM